MLCRIDYFNRKRFTMKTLTFMAFVGLFFCATSLNAQKTQERKATPFVRVFNYDGKKIGKGYIQEITEDKLVLVLRKKTKTLPIAEINTLKLKRSYGNSVAVGALIGTGIGVLTAISVDGASDDYFENIEYVVLPPMGFLSGTTIGAIVGIFRKPIEVQIDGRADNLHKFNSVVRSY